MSVYSNFATKRSSNAVDRRLRSRAYRTGFGQGFGAAGLFFMPSDYPRASAIDASVAAAWKAVGKALEAAGEKGIKQLGESTREKLTSD